MRIAFEGLLILILLVTTVFMVGIPAWKMVRALFPKKTDSLEEAKVRLEVAKKEAQAARLNKETEKVYSEIYEDILEEEESDRKKL
jgi:predicted HAD superfamily hydrolase